MFSASRRSLLTLVALLATCVAAAGVGLPSAASATLLPAPIPPEMRALEAKLSALQLTSLQVSLSASTDFGHGKEAKKLAKLLSLFDFKIEGVETIQPEAAALKVVLFGTALRLRDIAGQVYLYEYALGRHDHGRPWVRLEHGSLGKLFGGKSGSKKSDPANAGERFAALITKLNEGKEIRELGPSTVDGQQVLGFGEEVEGSTEVSGTEAGLFGAFSSSVHRAPPKTTLEVFMALDTGMPVKTVVRAGSGQVSSTVTIEFPAVNFPYTIAAPPAAEVIDERVLTRKARRRRTR